MPDERDRLLRVVRSLRGAGWTALRAAAGHPDDVAQLLEETAYDRIDRPLEAPRALGGKIELLAAWDPAALTALSRAWPEPKESARHLWWREVWRVAARHLVAKGTLTADALHPLHHADEIACLTADTSAPWSIEDAVRAVSGASELDVRKRSLRSLTHEAVPPSMLADPPWQVLRLLRGRQGGIDREGASLLAHRAMHEVGRAVTRRSTLLFEILVAMDDPIVGALQGELARRLVRVEPDEELLRATLVLATTWKVP